MSATCPHGYPAGRYVIQGMPCAACWVDYLDRYEALRVFAERVAAGEVRHAVVEARRALGQPLINQKND